MTTKKPLCTALFVCALLLTGCDKIGFEPPIIRTDEGLWETTLTTRVPEADVVATRIDQYCLTSEEVKNVIFDSRYIPNFDTCDPDIKKFKKTDNATRQEYDCNHPVIKGFTLNLITNQGNNVFDKFAVVEGKNVASVYRKQLRQAGLKKTPSAGDRVEIVEIGAFKGECEEQNKDKIRKKNRELSSGTTSTGAGGNIGSSLSDMLGN